MRRRGPDLDCIMLGPTLSDLKFQTLQALTRPRHSTLRGLGATAPDRYLGLKKSHFHSCFLGLLTAT